MPNLPEQSELEELLDEALPPRVHGAIWHYTNAEGLLGIVRSGSMWASSASVLNDSEELSFGLAFLEDTWRQFSKDFDAETPAIDRWMKAAREEFELSRQADSYVVSASRDGDSHSQFLMYGSYALGIDADVVFTKYAIPTGSTPMLSARFQAGWRPVVYEPDEQRMQFARMEKCLFRLARLEETEEVRRTAIDAILSCSAYLKHQSFGHEKEVRLYGRAQPTGAQVEFRSGRYGIVPYLRVQLASESPVTEGFPIVEVRVGPGLRDTGSAQAGLKIALRYLGYADVPVTLVAGSRRS